MHLPVERGFKVRAFFLLASNSFFSFRDAALIFCFFCNKAKEVIQTVSIQKWMIAIKAKQEIQTISTQN
jgi:hypothetical protein